MSSRVMAARQAEAAAADERVQLESTLQAARESLERSNQEARCSMVGSSPACLLGAAGGRSSGWH